VKEIELGMGMREMREMRGMRERDTDVE